MQRNQTKPWQFHMRIFRVMGLCGFPIVIALFVLHLRVEHQFARRAAEFERSLKQNVDPEELRRWALAFIREHPDTFGYATNAPLSIYRVAGRSPYVTVFEGGNGCESTVMLSWLRTDPSVQIGPTNFILPPDSGVKMWTAGVYIIEPRNF